MEVPVVGGSQHAVGCVSLRPICAESASFCRQATRCSGPAEEPRRRPVPLPPQGEGMDHEPTSLAASRPQRRPSESAAAASAHAHAEAGSGPGSSAGAAGTTGGGLGAASSYDRIALKFKGMNDETYRSNLEVREAVATLGRMFDTLESLEMRVADSEADLMERDPRGWQHAKLWHGFGVAAPCGERMRPSQLSTRGRCSCATRHVSVRAARGSTAFATARSDPHGLTRRGSAPQRAPRLGLTRSVRHGPRRRRSSSTAT